MVLSVSEWFSGSGGGGDVMRTLPTISERAFDERALKTDLLGPKDRMEGLWDLRFWDSEGVEVVLKDVDGHP